MLRRPLFKEFFASFLILGVLNYLANQYDWYWTITTFDSFMHFMGGVVVVLFFDWLYFYSGLFAPEQRSMSHFLLVSIFSLVLVAVAWEAYELLLGEANFHGRNYPFDTAIDFVMDTLGGLTACFYAYMKELESKKIDGQY